MGFVQANAAAAVRRAIDPLRDGEARAPLDARRRDRRAATVDRRRREATLDFTGSSTSSTATSTRPRPMVDAAALYVFRTLVDDDIPLNAGCLEPLKILTPRGLDAQPPPPGGGGRRQCRDQPAHGRRPLSRRLGVMAHSQGTMNNLTFGDETRQYYETLCGGAGRRPGPPARRGPHPHDQFAAHRSGDPGAALPGAARDLPGSARLRRLGRAARRRRGVRRRPLPRPMEAALLASRRTHAPRGLAGGGPAFPAGSV